MALQEVVVEAMWEDRIEDEDEAPDENVTSSWVNSREEAEDSESDVEKDEDGMQEEEEEEEEDSDQGSSAEGEGEGARLDPHATIYQDGDQDGAREILDEDHTAGLRSYGAPIWEHPEPGGKPPGDDDDDDSHDKGDVASRKRPQLDVSAPWRPSHDLHRRMGVGHSRDSGGGDSGGGAHGGGAHGGTTHGGSFALARGGRRLLFGGLSSGSAHGSGSAHSSSSSSSPGGPMLPPMPPTRPPPGPAR